MPFHNNIGMTNEEHEKWEDRVRRNLGGSHVLTKAISDPFYYVARLKTGEAFKFEYAKGDFDSEFILFTGVEDISGVPPELLRWSEGFERGIEVRRDQVAWIGDGSS